MIRPHNRTPQFVCQNLRDYAQMTKAWVSVSLDKHRELSVGASQKEVLYKLAKLKRSQGLSVTLLKLESDSGSGGNNLELVINSLKSLDLPKLEIQYLLSSQVAILTRMSKRMCI